MDGSPAQQAGLHSGDIILKVNGDDITGLPLEEAVTRITGKPGTSVTLTILSPKAGQSREISVVRAKITVRNVEWQRLPGCNVAHMRIAGFSQGVAEEVRKALTEVENQGLTALILDLRDNPGGVFDEAIGVASQFLSGGNVVLEKNGNGDVKPVPVEPGGLAPGIRFGCARQRWFSQQFGNCRWSPEGRTSGQTGWGKDFRRRYSAGRNSASQTAPPCSLQ